MSAFALKSQRSSGTISPFRARKTSASSSSLKTGVRPATPPVSHSHSKTLDQVIEVSEANKSKENVTVTVRFRPLSVREINKGDEIAWYADGDYTVRNEFNSSIIYGFDRVFGSATTTRHVYDVAAQHVVSGAMQGINGIVFAYGVTSSGKTHTMHGDQKSPGIIPLAVKDVFGIIQETPRREFLLRVSYLEIYNEVINDLLDPTGQNLRIREDLQGTYVEGIKEEVVLSAAHALSLIASGEEHRHVGSNNFNLLSSRSHTIFTLVIAKLTDGKATHVPYRDSKLTRLLQSSLSGHGRVSLICTVTPASSNSEETHNTLKFAHRSKHVEIKASPNKIMDEKSLIKKYQKEILSLKEELRQLKRGMIEKPYLTTSNQDDLVNLKLQLEAGQVKLQSRLEEEEQAKAALMGRIQRLTKLILVSTKNTMPPSIPEKAGHRRRHSFGEDELAYLPDRKRDYMMDDDVVSLDSEFSFEESQDAAYMHDSMKDFQKHRRRGMLGWLKLRKSEHLTGLSNSSDGEKRQIGSCATNLPSPRQKILVADMKDVQRKSMGRRGNDSSTVLDSFPQRTQAGDLFSATVGGRHLLHIGDTITDQMDLFREQLKMLSGEVALCTSSLKRLSDKAANNPEDSHLQEHIKKLKDDITEKKLQMRTLEKRMMRSIEIAPSIHGNIDIAQTLSTLTSQLNEKTFDLEIKSADNRILQDQLQVKISENAQMKETILLLRKQLNSLSGKCSEPLNQPKECDAFSNCATAESRENDGSFDGVGSSGENYVDESTPRSITSMPGTFLGSNHCDNEDASLDNLRQENSRLIDEKKLLEIQNQKLSEEASYAKELAAEAATELRNLAEEVAKLSYKNAKLTDELSAMTEIPICNNKPTAIHGEYGNSTDGQYKAKLVIELRNELKLKCQGLAALEEMLSEKTQREVELKKIIDEARQREDDMENELANMWVQLAKLKKSGIFNENSLDVRINSCDVFPKVIQSLSLSSSNAHDMMHGDAVNVNELNLMEGLRTAYNHEHKRCKELECVVSTLKSEDLTGLDAASLEELQRLHVEAITKICHAKMVSNTYSRMLNATSSL